MICVIEWQKTGPQHAHILAINHPDSKPRTPDNYDSIVSAEIPHKEQLPKVYYTVTTFMMHGLCGTINPSSPCMVDGICSKKFPQEFVEKTFASADGYPHYKKKEMGNILSRMMLG